MHISVKCPSHLCYDSFVRGTKFVHLHSRIKCCVMISPKYDECSCQSYELINHLIGPAKNVKSVNESGWSHF